MAEELTVDDRVRVVEIRDGEGMPQGLVALTGEGSVKFLIRTARMEESG